MARLVASVVEPPPPLGLKNARILPGVRWLVAGRLPELLGRAEGGRPEIVRVHRLGQILGDPRPHGGQELIAGERRPDGDEQERRVLVDQELGELDRQVRRVFQVEQDHFRRVGPDGLQLVLAHRFERHGHVELDRQRPLGPAQHLAGQLSELGIRADQRGPRHSRGAHAGRAFSLRFLCIPTRPAG